MPLFLRLLRAQQSATRAVIALPCTTPRTDRSSSVFSEMLTAGLYLELLSMKREGGDPPSFMWRRRRRRGEKWMRRLLRNRRGVQCVLPGAASPPPRHGFSLEDYMSPECALMSVEFFFLERTSSSRRVTADKLCVWRCVVAVMCRATATVKECLWCWLVWVLLSIPVIQRFCDTKKKMSCESCVFSSEGPFGPQHPPFLVLERHCKRSMGDFSTLCCNL